MNPICDTDIGPSTSNTVHGLVHVTVPVPVPRFVAVSEEGMKMRNKETVTENIPKKVAWAVRILHD
jgi:hypothetical protein